jgi:uncharacterized protein (TIGR02646 family)
MRNVTRPTKPESLRKNAARWRRDLLAARRQKTSPQRLSQLYDRYKRADVHNSLAYMYRGLCCYCESEIGVVAFEHIEHRKPKRRFPASCFDWSNLHLACPKCNQAKGDKWVARHPILDAVADIPIGKHLDYDVRPVLGVMRSAKTARGKTTIDDADLNHEKLCTARTRVAHEVWNLIKELNSAPDSPQVSQLRLELDGKTMEAYGGLVTWLMRVFLKTA